MTLDAVTKALKNLARDDSLDETEPDYFCVEDCFLSKDVNVSVEGIGDIIYPINENCVKKLIQISSKAVFGRGEKVVLDTNVRDTQTIPTSKLKVDINERSLAAVLERIGNGLSIENNCALVPHLYNMLIYGPGQFFDKHRDSEKIPKMVATLVVVLPSAHKGGDLIIEHNDKKHVFFGSCTPDIVKCIAFYSDCRHEIKQVTEGYRIALTFNVVLKSPNIFQTAKIDVCLEKAVKDYFRSGNHPKRLIFYMNHSYSKCSLKWSLLKGSDRIRGYALYLVAKRCGLKPCLALVEHQETYEVRAPYLEDELSESCTQPYFWVSWHDKEFVPPSRFRNDFYEEEICYTIETSDLLEPYRTDKDEGEPYGNSPETEDRWYKRACVVLLCDKKQFMKCQNHKEGLPNHLVKDKSSWNTVPGLANTGKIPTEITAGQANEARISTKTIPDSNEARVSSENIPEKQIFKDMSASPDTKAEDMTILPRTFYNKL